MSYKNQADSESISSIHDGGKEFVRVNIQIPTEMRKEWKSVALKNDKTLTDLIISAVQDHIIRVSENRKA